MKKIYLLFVVLFFFLTKLAWATPPSNIELEYDATERVLHITLRHVTHNVREHRIRRLIIYKNDEEIKSYYMPSQPSPKGIDKKVSLEAESGDEIRVKAICSEAGIGEATLTIPEVSNEEESDGEETLTIPAVLSEEER